MGLTSGAVSTFVFGLSPNFGTALGIRLAAGIFFILTFFLDFQVLRTVIMPCQSLSLQILQLARIELLDLHIWELVFQSLERFLGNGSSHVTLIFCSAISGLTTGIIISKSIPMLNDPYILPCLIGISGVFRGLIVRWIVQCNCAYRDYFLCT